jgi:hypothetical protein
MSNATFSIETVLDSLLVGGEDAQGLVDQPMSVWSCCNDADNIASPPPPKHIAQSNACDTAARRVSWLPKA